MNDRMIKKILSSQNPKRGEVMGEKVIFVFVLTCLAIFGFRGILPEMPSLALFGLLIITGLIGVYYHFKYLRNKRRIGSIAVSKGWLSSTEINQILYCQKDDANKFGEIAVCRNYLTPEQVASILEIQSSMP